MNSTFFKLNLQDLGKGIVVAILTAVVGGIQQALTAHGIDFASYDWGMILNLALSAGGAYLVKNLFSTDDGKFLGKIG